MLFRTAQHLFTLYGPMSAAERNNQTDIHPFGRIQSWCDALNGARRLYLKRGRWVSLLFVRGG
ncbi:hypothetical protein JJ691_103620 [Kutzneria sp. CA-103260]|nr:hypothetical protein JJ691_103620 [Kutzneria sp. CA-103260]